MPRFLCHINSGTSWNFILIFEEASEATQVKIIKTAKLKESNNEILLC